MMGHDFLSCGTAQVVKHEICDRPSPPPPLHRVSPLFRLRNAPLRPILAFWKVYERLTLDDMATVKSYQQWAKDCGLEFVDFTDLTENFEMHYTLVRASSPGTSLRGFSRCRLR